MNLCTQCHTGYQIGLSLCGCIKKSEGCVTLILCRSLLSMRPKGRYVLRLRVSVLVQIFVKKTIIIQNWLHSQLSMLIAERKSESMNKIVLKSNKNSPRSHKKVTIFLFLMVKM